MLDTTIATVLSILTEMGVENVSKDAVITAPTFYDGPVLLKNRGRFGHFVGQLAVKLRFVGYGFEDVAFLTVRRFCEMYVRHSFPAIPTSPLTDEQYELDHRPTAPREVRDPKEFPICFILGAGRSGTTLLRAMLDVHPGLWVPGELNLANFETMAERAHYVGPILRYMPVPEGAERCGQSIADFSAAFRGWEFAATRVEDVYQHLNDAKPRAMIVDKNPPNSAQLDTLSWIGEQFPNAKFIHLIRSPHDVIRSYVRMQFHRGARRLFEPGRNPYQAGEASWYACNTNAETFLSSIPAHRKRVLRYEDLTASPDESLRDLCELLECEFEPEMANPYAVPSSTLQGAGDLMVHLLDRVEHRRPIDAFYELGRRGQELADRYGY